MEGKHIYFREGLATVEHESEMVVRGYAVVFDEVTDRVGFFKEKIIREAFDGVDLSDVVLILGHDFNKLLAKNGVNMRIEIDDSGLWFEATLPQTQFARDTYELVKANILTGMSFGFLTSPDNIHTDYETNTDTITKIDRMLEITLTPIPAYPQTVATAVERKQKHEAELKRQQEAEEKMKLIKKLEEL